jgi:[protein-PII] uridylyltransferase
MNRYGVLAAYLPVFARVVGRMQYDLFHAYTVDEHTLFLVRNLRRFTVPEYAHEFPLCSEVIQRLHKPHLLYIAGLFHDIAKGRGGDHSELGAGDAEQFCVSHGLGRYDTGLVCWLVRHHLLMSTTAQRCDIGDPEVIHEFARKVGDQTHLNYLYLLTVADIRATNPTLWNSWKSALLAELYAQTKRALRRGLENPLDKDTRIAEIQQEALAVLADAGLSAGQAGRVWADFTEDYFLRYSAAEIAWHTRAIAQAGAQALPLVLVREDAARGGTAVFLHAEAQDHLFALATALLDQLDLTILDARLTSARSGRTLDTYLVLEADGAAINEARAEEIHATLGTALRAGESRTVVSRRPARVLRHFPTATQVHFSDDERNQRTVLELISADRPGLLSRVGRAFQDCGVRVHNAKIATLGARAEDFFFITTADNRPYADPDARECLRTRLIDLLDAH